MFSLCVCIMPCVLRALILVMRGTLTRSEREISRESFALGIVGSNPTHSISPFLFSFVYFVAALHSLSYLLNVSWLALFFRSSKTFEGRRHIRFSSCVHIRNFLRLLVMFTIKVSFLHFHFCTKCYFFPFQIGCFGARRDGENRPPRVHRQQQASLQAC
jgi:hypothetical protein